MSRLSEWYDLGVTLNFQGLNNYAVSQVSLDVSGNGLTFTKSDGSVFNALNLIGTAESNNAGYFETECGTMPLINPEALILAAGLLTGPLWDSVEIDALTTLLGGEVVEATAGAEIYTSLYDVALGLANQFVLDGIIPNPFQDYIAEPLINSFFHGGGCPEPSNSNGRIWTYGTDYTRGVSGQVPSNYISYMSNQLIYQWKVPIVYADKQITFQPSLTIGIPNALYGGNQGIITNWGTAGLSDQTIVYTPSSFVLSDNV